MATILVGSDDDGSIPFRKACFGHIAAIEAGYRHVDEGGFKMHYARTEMEHASCRARQKEEATAAAVSIVARRCNRRSAETRRSSVASFTRDLNEHMGESPCSGEARAHTGPANRSRRIRSATSGLLLPVINPGIQAT